MPAEQASDPAPAQLSVKKLEPPQLVRSHLLLNSDRYGLETNIMTHLKSGSGLLGLSKVSLEQEKRTVCKVEGEKPMY